MAKGEEFIMTKPIYCQCGQIACETSEGPEGAIGYCRDCGNYDCFVAQFLREPVTEEQKEHMRALGFKVPEIGLKFKIQGKKEKVMDWIQALTIGGMFLANIVTVITLYVHQDSKSTNLLAAIHAEMKDFHGRLCAIEERNRK